MVPHPLGFFLYNTRIIFKMVKVILEWKKLKNNSISIPNPGKFNPKSHRHLFILLLRQIRNRCHTHPPAPPPPPSHPQFSLEFSTNVARTEGQLLLVDGSENDSDEGPTQYSSAMSGDSMKSCEIMPPPQKKDMMSHQRCSVLAKKFNGAH